MELIGEFEPEFELVASVIPQFFDGANMSNVERPPKTELRQGHDSIGVASS